MSRISGPTFELLSRLEVGALDAVRSAAPAGIGFAVLPRLSVAEDLSEGRLQQLRFPAYRRVIHAVRRRSVSSPTVEAFWQALISSTDRRSVSSARSSDQVS